MDTDHLELQVLQAGDAARVQEANADKLARMERRIVDAIASTPISNKDGIMDLVHRLQTIRQFGGEFQRDIDAGKVAQERISWLKKMQRRFAA